MRASLVLCGGRICHASLFLRSCETIRMQRVRFATSHLNSKTRCIIWHLCVSLVQCSVCAQVSRGWQAARCTDKISFVQLSNAGRVVPLLAAWGHLLTRTLLLMLLCICLCLVLRQWSDWFSCGCLCVGSVSYLKCFIVPVCLVLSCQTAAVHRELWIHLSRSQGF